MSKKKDKDKGAPGLGGEGQRERAEAGLSHAAAFLTQILPYEQNLRNAYRLARSGVDDGSRGHLPPWIKPEDVIQRGWAELQNCHGQMRAALADAKKYDRWLQADNQRIAGCPGCPECATPLLQPLYNAVEARLDTELPPAPEGSADDLYAPDNRALFAKWLYTTGRINEGLPRSGR